MKVIMPSGPMCSMQTDGSNQGRTPSDARRSIIEESSSVLSVSSKGPACSRTSRANDRP